MPANTGIIDGGDLLLYAEITAVWTLVAEAKSHTVDNTADVRVRRTKSTGLTPGRKIIGLDTKITTDCLATYNGWGYYELRALQQSRTNVKLKVAGRTTAGKGVAEQIGDKYEEGTFVISSITQNAPDSDDAGFTATFEIDGAASPNGFEIKTKAA